ncbi:hypothetical protein [Methanoregula sp.]|uniref:hypothetical protein n=1 Tax=Methanoregula sp. TaxID=2052170 RepID=UPI002BCCACDD|nr:hypothetical protein [Methanoregula sp.]HVP95922.1 hypothetical protein [Methanoregula sp.]
MSGRGYLFLGLFLLLFLAAAGCTTYSVGDVSYQNGTLDVAVAGPGTPADVTVQVTVYSLTAYSQQELLTTWATATLTGSKNMVAVPLQLDPGNYKMYVYITENGRREAAVIRDITV